MLPLHNSNAVFQIMYRVNIQRVHYDDAYLFFLETSGFQTFLNRDPLATRYNLTTPI